MPTTIHARLLRLAQRLAGANNVTAVMIIDRAGGVTSVSFPLAVTGIPAEPPLAVLREVEKNLMEAATEEPKNGERMCQDAGYADSSHPRAALANLVKLGLLVKVHGGYRLPERQ